MFKNSKICYHLLLASLAFRLNFLYDSCFHYLQLFLFGIAFFKEELSTWTKQQALHMWIIVLVYTKSVNSQCQNKTVIW